MGDKCGPYVAMTSHNRCEGVPCPEGRDPVAFCSPLRWRTTLWVTADYTTTAHRFESHRNVFLGSIDVITASVLSCGWKADTSGIVLEWIVNRLWTYDTPYLGQYWFRRQLLANLCFQYHRLKQLWEIKNEKTNLLLKYLLLIKHIVIGNTWPLRVIIIY